MMVAGSGGGFADEMDLEARDSVEQMIRQRRPAEVEPAVRPVNKHEVGHAPLSDHFLQAAGDV